MVQYLGQTYLKLLYSKILACTLAYSILPRTDCFIICTATPQLAVSWPLDSQKSGISGLERSMGFPPWCDGWSPWCDLWHIKFRQEPAKSDICLLADASEYIEERADAVLKVSWVTSVNFLTGLARCSSKPPRHPATKMTLKSLEKNSSSRK